MPDLPLMAATEWARSNSTTERDPVAFGHKVAQVYWAAQLTQHHADDLVARTAALLAPIPVPVAQLSVLEVLEMCEREFAFIGGCTLTDSPNVPLSAETSWTMNFATVLAAIAAAKAKLGGGVDCSTAGECTGCSTAQPMGLTSIRSRFEQEPLDTHGVVKDSA